MSKYIVEERPSLIGRPNFGVKILDEKWKNFPAATIHKLYVEKLDSFKNFSIRPDDIFILGYPRSGTSRLQELVWIIANDYDFETLLEYDADARCINFEIPEWSFKWREKPFAKSFEEMSSPRLMKCHLPVQLLPDEVWTKKPKLFYISRDPKDVAISQFHQLNHSFSIPGKFEDYIEDFLADNTIYAPYRENMVNYLNLPDYQNILYLTYEEMSADLDGTIQKVADFLGKAVTTENAEKIKDYLKFENMKARKTNDNKQTFKLLRQDYNRSDADKDYEFIRRGVVGGYKDEMSQEYIEKIDKWFAERCNLNQGFSYKEEC